jgi:tetratricopeptide (TPR) repeat protein
LEAKVRPFVFSAENDQLGYARSPLNSFFHPSINTAYSTWRLPDGTGIGLLGVWRYASDENFQAYVTYFDYSGCVDEGRQVGSVNLWRFENGAFVSVFQNAIVICDQPTLADIFPEGEGGNVVSGWGYTLENGYHYVTYMWDNAQLKYLSEQQRLQTPSPQTYSYSAIYETDHLVERSWDTGDYEAALNLIDQAIETASQTQDDYLVRSLQNLYYWRGLTYELMGDAENAVSEYVYTYELAPESVWGRLAALHFE